MPQYSLGQLVTRANAGLIGSQGRRKLQRLGVDPSTLGHAVQNAVAAPVKAPDASMAHTVASSVAPAGTVDRTGANPNDLQARRALLYGRAVQSAEAGGPLSAALQHRLSVGVGDQPLAAQIVAPRSQAGVQGLGENNVNSILDAIRRRRGAVASKAGIYNF